MARPRPEFMEPPSVRRRIGRTRDALSEFLTDDEARDGVVALCLHYGLNPWIPAPTCVLGWRAWQALTDMERVAVAAGTYRHPADVPPVDSWDVEDYTSHRFPRWWLHRDEWPSRRRRQARGALALASIAARDDDSHLFRALRDVFAPLPWPSAAQRFWKPDEKIH